MTRGRTAVVLSEHDRKRLRRFRQRHGNYLGVHLGLPALRTAMQAPFRWETLRRAMEGLPVSPETRDWIVAFLNSQEPPSTPAQRRMDYKSLAAGERNNGEEEDAARTLRGSR